MPPPTSYAYSVQDYRLVEDGVGLPQSYVLNLLYDTVRVTVAEEPGLGPNQMNVTLEAPIAGQKGLIYWNSVVGYEAQEVTTPGPFEGYVQPDDGIWKSSMTLVRHACGDDTIVLRKASPWLMSWYHFDPTNFWFLWGGKHVTIRWLDDLNSFSYTPTCDRQCPPIGFQVPTDPASKLVGDFNGDGRSDLAVLGEGGFEYAFSNGSGGFNPRASTLPNFGNWAKQPGARELVGDFDGDGSSDIALTGVNGWGSIPVVLHRFFGTRELNVVDEASQTFAYFAAQPGVKPLVGDYNGDGLSDIALIGGSGWASIPVAFSLGTGAFRLTNLQVPSFPQLATDAKASALVGDFDGDGNSDVALLGGHGWRSIAIARSVGDGRFDFRSGYNDAFGYWAESAHVRKLIGDFDGDRRSDIALVGGWGWASIPVAFAPGDASFRVTNEWVGDFAGKATSSTNLSVLVGDFDGDGASDLALSGPSRWSTIPVALSQRNGGFHVNDPSLPDFALYSSSFGVARLVGRFDNDRKADIALTGVDGWQSIPLALSDGGESFRLSNISFVADAKFSVISAH
jgi:hypothetical protein